MSFLRNGTPLASRVGVSAIIVAIAIALPAIRKNKGGKAKC